MSSMNAVVLRKFGGTENLELAEIAQPEVKYGEVLIRIRSTAFNPIDYQMRQGASEAKLLKSDVLGRELSGEIVQLGEGVGSFAVGDKVAAYVGSMASNGTYAEYISVPSTLIARIPPQLTFEQAAAIPMVGMTALQCFRRVVVPKEKPVFIAGGAGGVGTILIKLFLSSGNRNIYTTAGSIDTINHLKDIGVSGNNIINYKEYDVADVLSKRIGCFDYVIDLVGGKMSEACAELVEIFGTYVDVTFLATGKARELLFDKAATIVNIANYAPSLGNGPEKYRYFGDALGEIFDKIDRGIISPTDIRVVGSLSVDTVREAHRLMEQNETKGRKLIMTMVTMD